MLIFVHLLDWCLFKLFGVIEGVRRKINRLSFCSWKQTERSEWRRDSISIYYQSFLLILQEIIWK